MFTGKRALLSSNTGDLESHSGLGPNATRERQMNDETRIRRTVDNSTARVPKSTYHAWPVLELESRANTILEKFIQAQQ